MTQWQQILVFIYGLVAFYAFLSSLRACYKQKKSFAETPIFGVLFSGFVQADNVVFGFFWTVVSFYILIVQDWILFLLILSVFWLVRAIGETIYWFFQQFHPRPNNEPEKFWFFRIFHNDSVWFVIQIFWQCITIITIITTIYLANFWLKGM